ncbi:hypothetical protein ACFU51_34670 [Streptomyces sp. NPDC057430]
MARKRAPKPAGNDQRSGPMRVQLLIAFLTAVAAIAGCVEQLAR